MRNKWKTFNQSLCNTWTACMQFSPAMLALYIEMEKIAWYHKNNSLQATCYPLCRGKIERSKNFMFLCIHSTSTFSAQAEDLSWIIQDQTCWGCLKFNTSALQEILVTPYSDKKAHTRGYREHKIKYTASSNYSQFPLPTIFLNI